MKALADAAKAPARVYLVGGASAVLLGWREATIDVDLKIIPESDEILRSLPQLKEQLKINIELASPDDFIPPLPGWEDRSQFIQQEGKLSFYHYDFYAQALAKIERGHDRDREDFIQMTDTGLVDPNRLLSLFNSIKNQLYRYPELDAESFSRAVERAVADAKSRLSKRE
ncbi:MAG TPA: DUF6036 family nucleotidyltransferase [Pyrinomonadaceae bacterium]